MNHHYSRVFDVNLLSLENFLLSEEILSKSTSSLIKKSSSVAANRSNDSCFFLFGCFGINVHRCLNVFMPHDRLDDLQVGLIFRKALYRMCDANCVQKSLEAKPHYGAVSLMPLLRPHCNLQ